MPYAPARPCPVCRKLHCEQHKHRERARSVQSAAAQALYNHRWRQARVAYLAQNPLCLECQRHGRLVAACVVDHIEAHRGDYGKFWDRDNWAALCRRCHDSKTAREDVRH